MLVPLSILFETTFSYLGLTSNHYRSKTGNFSNEMKQVGKDYSKFTEVEQYDARHSDFRDLEKESDTVLDSLDSSFGVDQ